MEVNPDDGSVTRRKALIKGREAKAIGCHLVATFVRRPEPSRYGRYAAGRMFWFTRNRFAGSYLLLHRGEPRVVVAVARLDARLAFVVHHEVDVGAARG